MSAWEPAVPGTAREEILKTVVRLGLSAVELRTQSVEVFMGAPSDLIFPPRNAPKAEAADRTEKLRQWRAAAPMDSSFASTKGTLALERF